jgi:hypothetical protein
MMHATHFSSQIPCFTDSKIVQVVFEGEDMLVCSADGKFSVVSSNSCSLP